MQETSELYQSILRTKGHIKETRVLVDGIEPEKVVSCQTDRELYTDSSDDLQLVGCCISRTITLKFIPGGDVPKKAKIELFVRLCYEEQVSEWVPEGVFFINTRETDTVTGIMTIEGYDALRNGDVIWEPDQSLEFPLSAPDAAEEFARLMGVELDPETSLDPRWTIDYPANDYTIREELEYIAQPHVGNWTTTGDGKLFLVPFLSAPKETNYLVEEYGDAITFGGDRILV